MTPKLTRRQLLALPLGLLVLPRLASAETSIRKTFSYQADMGVLFDLLTFHVTGTVVEEIDYAAGRYRVVLTGEGSGVTHRTESLGMIRGGRFLPTASWSGGASRARENRSSPLYDYDRGTVNFHTLGHTL